MIRILFSAFALLLLSGHLVSAFDGRGVSRRGLRQIQAESELPASLGEQSLSQSVNQEAASFGQGTGAGTAATEWGAGQTAQSTQASQQGQQEEWEEGYEGGVTPGELEREEEELELELEAEGFEGGQSEVNDLFNSQDVLAAADLPDELEQGQGAATTASGGLAVGGSAGATAKQGSGIAELPYDESIERAIAAHDEEPLKVEALDATLEAENAIEATRKEEAKAEAVMEGLKERGSGLAPVSNASTAAKTATAAAKAAIASNKSATAEAPSAAAKNSTILAQGAIIGSAISGAVKEHSTGIAGVVGIVLAGAAGVGVAFAGISLYKRYKNRRHSSSGMPRIIEIGALSGSRKPKSPSYSRVTTKNQDQQGPSGTRWQNFDSHWETDDPLAHGTTSKPAEGRQKKAWDWDADW